MVPVVWLLAVVEDRKKVKVFLVLDTRKKF
jgi:hypothetical protein